MTETLIYQACIAAVRTQFPATVAKKIEQSEAIGALAHRVRERGIEHGQTPTDVLAAIEDCDHEFACRAEDPAAFLAAKIRDLPAPQPQVNTTVPTAVGEIIDAVRAFIDTVERVGATEFAAATRELARPAFAWTVDQLDDVRQSLGSLFEQLAEVAEEHGAAPRNWDEIGADLERAGDGAYMALGEIDPDAERHAIPGHL